MSEIDTPIEVDEISVSKEFDENVKKSQIVSEWLTKFEYNTLSESDFGNYWKIWVPRIFKPEFQGNILIWSLSEKNTEQTLFISLEEFICGGNNIEVLRSLTQQNYPPSVCVRVFKMGEPTYNCQECGMDMTCVLCVDCFKRSPHKNHEYKMGISYGGGRCDCGDIEAWKQDVYCQTHELGLEKKHVNSNLITYDMEKRAHLVFQSVLRYACTLITLEHPPLLPAKLDTTTIDRVENYLDFNSNPHLQCIYKNLEDKFCTVLYNDETHTYGTLDEVITILTSVIKYPQRESIDLATSIDREGRAVVKFAGFMQCNDLKEEVKKFTSHHNSKHIKPVVIHSHVIAHQIYALRLLKWMQNLLGCSERLRAVFSNVVLESNITKGCILERILRNDSALWKLARLQWRKLFIAGMFIEYENKKNFAKVFTKNYGAVMKDFINNYYDYSYSVASLGAQIFTVPTLANYLMVHHNVLYEFLHSFLTECFHKINKQGKLQFERNTSILPFKRALYVFRDIRFLLGCVPETWNSDLRESFYHAVSLVLRILNYMQNMDAISKQMGQHMEYDSEWNTAFNLLFKLRPLITKILLWCGSDSIILKKVYRMTLEKIRENSVLDSQRPNLVKKLNNFEVYCVDYDVSTEPVSIHLPLTRFLAGLHLYLDRYGLSFEHSELHTTKQSPEQIIEPALRSLVLISQINAGMWMRNRLSKVQKFMYYYSKCRVEMLDKDIVILQIGASLIDSNEFLIHVLNKFNLFKWADFNFEHIILKGSEDESISLVDEFLTLIITIVGERYTPGVGKVTLEDCIKKEVIQQLCVRPMPHSELKKTLLNIFEDDECLEKVINEVAVFKKTKEKGVYELKPIYYDDYNVFFYHYTREEISTSEEEQIKRKEAVGELECCPPPCLPLFSDPFSKVANILQCDVMFYIMKLILDRVNLRNKSSSESQLHKILHLIGYALHEEQKQQSPTFTFTERSEPYGIEAALDELRRIVRFEACKDLVIWTLNKFRQVSTPRRKSEEKVEVDEEDVKNEDAEKKKQKRAKFAADRKAAVMAQMAQMQNNFMKDNATLFENTPTCLESHTDSLTTVENIGDLSSSLDSRYTCILCREKQLVTLDGQAMVLATFVQKSSVLCQVRSSSRNVNDIVIDPYYIPANFGPSPHVSTCGHVMHDSCWQKYVDMLLTRQNGILNLMSDSLCFDAPQNEYLCPLCKGLCNTVTPLLPTISSFTKPENIKTFENLTFENWLEGLNMALNQSEVTLPKASENTTVEKSASDSVVNQQTTRPELQQRQTPTRRDLRETREFPFMEQAGVVAGIAIGNNNTDQVVALRDNNENAKDEEDDEKEVLPPSNQPSIGTNGFITQILMFDKLSPKVVPKRSVTKNSKLSTSLVDTILKFAHSTYSNATGYHNSNNNQIPLMTWKACAYTIHSNEVILRYKNQSLLGQLSSPQASCLEALIRVSGFLSSTWKNDHEINLHALRLLSLAINNGGNNSIGILDWDAFGMLVSLTMTLPSLYYTEVPGPAPSGTMLDFHTLLLMFIANLIQIILTIDIKEDSEEVLEMDFEEVEDTSCIADLVYKLRGITIKNTVAVWNMVENCALPFLRCCSLFYHFLAGVPASGVLTELNGDTYHNMCCYLGLPSTCKDVLNKPYVEMLINKWTENEKLVKIRQGEKIPFKVWTHINELVRLPDNYSEIFNVVSMLNCLNSDHESRNPTMCLMCGAIVWSQSNCFQTEVKDETVKACCGHAISCGCGVGVFLRLRECEILLIATLNKESFYSPPYLDKYGETDPGLKRGNPLYLCKEQYRNLQMLWLGHELHEEISRYLHSTPNLLSIT